MLIDKAVETAPQTQQTENGQTESAIKPVSETAPITVDFERLQEENKDIIAWLYCPDTEINYPVVQSKDNEYYLRRLLDGTWNIAGTLFMDYRNAADCSDLHTIIYGHNMKNNTMFGSLHRTEGSKSGCYFNVNTTKTPASMRQVPMLGFVREAFEQEKQKQEDLGLHCEVTIDGYTDFIFINRFGQAQHQATLNKAIRRIIRDCNDEQFLHSDEPDVLLPHFSCHSLRHTFTTRMCEAGVNIKVIQDALGHSDISTTLNIYADVTKEMKAEEFKGLDSYFKV